MIDSKRISLYMIVYNSAGTLEATIDCFKEIIDELIIVDGAYSYMEPILNVEGLTIQSDSQTIEILDRCCSNQGFDYIYHSGVWKDEVKKREFAYSKCTGDLILTIDSDEPATYDVESIRKFIYSRYTVAPIWTNTIIDYPGLADGIEYQKKVLFRRDCVSPEDHCAYLLMIGADVSGIAHPEMCSPEPVGYIYHLCELRPINDIYYRQIFYQSMQEKYRTGLYKQIQQLDYAQFKSAFMYNAINVDPFFVFNQRTLRVLSPISPTIDNIIASAIEDKRRADKTLIPSLGVYIPILVKKQKADTWIDISHLEKGKTIKITYSLPLTSAQLEIVTIDYDSSMIAPITWTTQQNSGNDTIQLPCSGTNVIKTYLHVCIGIDSDELEEYSICYSSISYDSLE